MEWIYWNIYSIWVNYRLKFQICKRRIKNDQIFTLIIRLCHSQKTTSISIGKSIPSRHRLNNIIKYRRQEIDISKDLKELLKNVILGNTLYHCIKTQLRNPGNVKRYSASCNFIHAWTFQTKYHSNLSGFVTNECS